MLAEMVRKNPGVGVIAATRRITDDEFYLISRIEIGNFVSDRRRTECDRCDRRQRKNACEHRVSVGHSFLRFADVKSILDSERCCSACVIMDENITPHKLPAARISARSSLAAPGNST
jgi:hypothetical protein